MADDHITAAVSQIERYGLQDSFVIVLAFAVCPAMVQFPGGGSLCRIISVQVLCILGTKIMERHILGQCRARKQTLLASGRGGFWILCIVGEDFPHGGFVFWQHNGFPFFSALLGEMNVQVAVS